MEESVIPACPITLYLFLFFFFFPFFFFFFFFSSSSSSFCVSVAGGGGGGLRFPRRFETGSNTEEHAISTSVRTDCAIFL